MRLSAAIRAEMRPNHVQPVVADLFIGGKRAAVTHTVVQADIDKAGHELLLSDNWVSADCQWSVWTGANYRYLTVADAEKGESIDDLPAQETPAPPRLCVKTSGVLADGSAR